MQKQQRGFTLIELVVVIIILGILAVVAAPKFINLKSDAVIANLNGLQGALKSANTLVYSKAVLAGQEKLDPGSVTLNGSAVSTTLGYITSSPANLQLVLEGSFEEMTNANDEITADWGLYDTPGKTMYIYPKGYIDTSNCSLLYNVDSSQAEPVFYSLTTSGC
ncbi:PilD processed protein [Shewanella algicola]|uniref:Prepilin-type N-terminal cleavage/methylation domain-containing protein n=1 Tax=Shewanella algicola TaxID=640633 RepID=A0A9X1Z3P9_9GAMM|nr:prepilin-type N-terminal cleavage/methylation domain-containing protein [Shewanella algicola]MCL1104625.1 prepilin-type N-terminal cleavage/methylation domain-containing protein [Shewanella algicola]GGP67498.1 PilD processed protein [Shewanella algicola]